jgi:hypothetical protein
MEDRRKLRQRIYERKRRLLRQGRNNRLTVEQANRILAAEYTARRIAMKEVKLASGSESTGPQCNEVCRTQDGVKAQEHSND